MKSVPPLDIIIAAPSWLKVKGIKSRLNKACATTLSMLPGPMAQVAGKAQMSLLMTTNKAVQELNRDYRGMDKPTNVLSFPQYEPRDVLRQKKAIGSVYMGDIVVAFQYVMKEAAEEQKTALNHTTHLLIHGILHLFGYDHDTVAKARKMEGKEKEIMVAMGLPDPYALIDDKAEKVCKTKTRKR